MMQSMGLDLPDQRVGSRLKQTKEGGTSVENSMIDQGLQHSSFDKEYQAKTEFSNYI